MKVISYSIFKDCPDWLFGFYLRGLYFNMRMNRLIYPGWYTFIYYEDFEIIRPLIMEQNLFRLSFIVAIGKNKNNSRCESMLWRLKPIWAECHLGKCEYLICRDTDAITTYRESLSVKRWIESGKDAHGMNDSPAHGGLHLMGGMCGFKADAIRSKYNSWESLIEGYDLREHGSDQQLLMDRVYPLVKDSFYFDPSPDSPTDNALWESQLTCRHIGSAGVVEMELLRFFERHDPDNDKFVEFEKTNTDLFYWRK